VEKTAPLVGGLIELHPLFVGIGATVLAAFTLLAFVAMGSVFLPRPVLEKDEIATPSSILVGSATTAFIYALLTRAALVDESIIVVAAGSVIALVTRRRVVWSILKGTSSVFHDVFEKNRLLRFVAPPVAALMWIYAIAPPRDGDVLRYHLAHIRQIIADGKWEAIADYHYAFPFGWTFNYLPFERLHVPQAAALMNVGLWLVIVAGLLRIASTAAAPRLAELTVFALFVHPFVLRIFASAMADAYATACL